MAANPNDAVSAAEQALREAQRSAEVMETPDGDVYRDPVVRVQHLRALLSTGHKIQDHEVRWLADTLAEELGG